MAVERSDGFYFAAGAATLRRVGEQGRHFLLRVRVLAPAELSGKIFCGAEEVVAENFSGGRRGKILVAVEGGTRTCRDSFELRNVAARAG